MFKRLWRKLFPINIVERHYMQNPVMASAGGYLWILKPNGDLLRVAESHLHGCAVIETVAHINLYL